MKKKPWMSLVALGLAATISLEGSLIVVSATNFNIVSNQGEMTIGEAVATSVREVVPDDVQEPVTVSQDGLIAEATYSSSGSSSVAKMSKSSIANYLNAIYSKSITTMSVPAGVSAPYSLGSPTQEHYDYAIASVNLMRQIAGLPAVTINDTYNSYAQHGSVLLAATRLFQHEFSVSEKPSGMTNEFFENGCTGTSRGNISYGFPSSFYTMAGFTNGYMQDNSGYNVTCIGHRRWILNPSMGQTGFGYAVNSRDEAYSAMYAFDNSATAPDYDFIAWPSSGNFPNTLMSAGDPWSITLNPNKFKTYNMTVNNISVTITAPNGVSKTFSAADYKEATDSNMAYINNKSKSYFNVELNGYGVSNAIIFRPGTDVFGTAALNGSYTVVVSGLKDSLGTPATLCYTVDFFDTKTAVTDPDADITSINKKVDEAAITAFVSRLYSTCLNRGGDAEGMLYWKEQLINGETTGALASQDFFFSAEMKAKNLTDEQFLVTLYAVMMDRVPDADGLAYWMDLLNKGVGRTGVLADFATSPEYTEICGDYGIKRGEAVISEGRDRNFGATQFISRLYTKALGRTYDVDGLNYWCDCLLDKQFTAAEIASTQFFHSKEFLDKKLGDREYIEVLYRTFLGREHDEDGMNYWLKQMRAMGETRDEVLYEFAGSREFRAIMARYGI